MQYCKRHTLFEYSDILQIPLPKLDLGSTGVCFERDLVDSIWLSVCLAGPGGREDQRNWPQPLRGRLGPLVRRGKPKRIKPIWIQKYDRHMHRPPHSERRERAILFSGSDHSRYAQHVAQIAVSSFLDLVSRSDSSHRLLYRESCTEYRIHGS